MRFLNHFDLLAPFYDLVIKSPDSKRLTEILDLPISGRLLDAGGGTGRIAEGLTEHAGRVVVSDTSLKMLRQARFKGGLDLVGGETERLPFPDDSFERVMIVDAFHHLADQALSLNEFWRVLAPGGLLVIEEPDIRRMAVKLVALAEKVTLFRSHFIPAERIATLLEKYNAKVTVYREGHTAWVVGEKTSTTSPELVLT
ncbi:MAG TPA: methyltransferase domain-containing protein [Anaerolineae bacterium]|nr:methyltransferase domain-containing protein [Anaerolineae bacterium]